MCSNMSDDEDDQDDGDYEEEEEEDDDEEEEDESEEDDVMEKPSGKRDGRGGAPSSTLDSAMDSGDSKKDGERISRAPIEQKEVKAKPSGKSRKSTANDVTEKKKERAEKKEKTKKTERKQQSKGTVARSPAERIANEIKYYVPVDLFSQPIVAALLNKHAFLVDVKEVEVFVIDKVKPKKALALKIDDREHKLQSPLVLAYAVNEDPALKMHARIWLHDGVKRLINFITVQDRKYVPVRFEKRQHEIGERWGKIVPFDANRTRAITPDAFMIASIVF